MVTNKVIDERIKRAISSDGELDLSNLGPVDFLQLKNRLRSQQETRLNRGEAVHPVVTLNLSGNSYKKIDGSALAGALPRLANLNLSYNSFRGFPVGLAKATGLSNLNLIGNGIRTLSIGDEKFRTLRTLSVARNGLESIADDISALSALEILDLTGNLLLDLPFGLSAVEHLRELLIGDNPGLAPSSSITGLRNLRLLDLSDNHLKVLPAELGSLHPDITIKLKGNFFDDVLQLAAIKGDTRTILETLRSRADAVPNYEAKLIVVGEGNVGKTSLVEALLGRPFIEGRDTTHGIEIKSLKIPNPLPAVDEPLTLRSWDFGGQEVYRITHQFFFSPRSITLLLGGRAKAAMKIL